MINLQFYQFSLLFMKLISLAIERLNYQELTSSNIMIKKRETRNIVICATDKREFYWR